MQVRVLALQALLLECVGQHVHQLVELKRLRDEVGGAALDDVDRVLHGAVAGHDDGDDAGVAGEGGVDDLSAVHARQAEIRDDDIKSKTVECFKG